MRVASLIDANLVRELLDYDPETGAFSSKDERRASVCGTILGPMDGYLSIMIDGKSLPAHRVAYAHYHGFIDPRLSIDHLDCDKQHNPIFNLEMITIGENIRRGNKAASPELKRQNAEHRFVMGHLPRIYGDGVFKIISNMTLRQAYVFSRIRVPNKLFEPIKLAALDYIGAYGHLSVDDLPDFEIKTYRVEWATEVYFTDQYGQRENRDPIYKRSWPIQVLAESDLNRVSSPHKYVQGRRTSYLAKTDYHDCAVRKYEVLQ